jgi:hypothetical protein
LKKKTHRKKNLKTIIKININPEVIIGSILDNNAPDTIIDINEILISTQII